jgi:hypothetical protein
LLLSLFSICFQTALAAGAPWGRLTWGGKYPGRLPPAMRAVAIVSAVVIGALAAVVATRAGLVLPQWNAHSRVLIWGVVTFCAVGVLANAATPSRWERRIWLPVVVLMLIASVVVAVG